MRDQQAWSRLLDEIHDGIAHVLNGRVAGIDGLVQVAQMRGDFDAELFDLLTDELRRLREVAEAAGALPRLESPNGTVSVVGDVVRKAVIVNRVRRGVRAVPQPPAEDAAVTAPPEELLRTVLLVLAAAESAVADGDVARMEIEQAGDDTVVRLIVRPVSELGLLQEMAAEAVDGARAAAELAGGTLTTGRKGRQLELTLTRAQ